MAEKSAEQDQFHAPAGGDLFAPSALCGARPDGEPNGVLRMHQPGLAVTCVECRRLLLEGENHG